VLLLLELLELLELLQLPVQSEQGNSNCATTDNNVRSSWPMMTTMS
jgi:hypothetical protein